MYRDYRIHYCMKWHVVNISFCNLVLHILLLQLKRTALHLASISGHAKVCQVLLQAEPNVHVTDRVSTIILILSTLVTVQKLKISYIFFYF